MALQIPNPSVQSHTEEPVLSQIDSNADDGLLDETETLEYKSCFKYSDEYMLKCAKRICDMLANHFRTEMDNLLFASAVSLVSDWSCKRSMERFREFDSLEDTRVLPMENEKHFSLENAFLDHTKCDSALWEVNHSSFGRVHYCWKFWGAGSEQQLGSDNTVCQDFGDKSKWDVQGLSKSWSVNGKHFLGQRISPNQLGLVHLIPQNYFPSLHTASNLCEELNILPSVNQVKQISTTAENNLSLDNQESCVVFGTDLREAVKFDCKMVSQQHDHYTDWSLNKHRETMPKDPMFQVGDITNQHKRKETAECVSTFLFLAALSFSCLLMTCSDTLLRKYLVATSIVVQSLRKERGPVSIGVPLLGLFGFMVFVWAVAVMILVGSKLTRFHSAMILFCAILMHVRSDNSINALSLPILGIFFIGWFARGKATMKAEKFSCTVIPEYVTPRM